MSAQKASLVIEGKEIFSDSGTWALFQVVRTAQITHITGGYRLDYPIDLTVAGHKINESGSAARATFELTGPGAEFLVGEGFNGLNCVPAVAK
jgi:hypothetical protein